MTVPGPFTMSQQAQDDHYGDPEAAAMAYAAVVNAEVRDLFAAGADVVQIDEPYMQARPEAARAYGLAALNAALDGVTGTTAVHICFGYAAIIHERPEGYSFLPELAGSPVQQISIETAQSGLDLGVLRDLTDKTIILGVLDLSDPAVETAETVAGRAPSRPRAAPAGAGRPRPRLRAEVPAARRGRGQDARARRRGGAAARGARVDGQALVRRVIASPRSRIARLLRSAERTWPPAMTRAIGHSRRPRAVSPAIPPT